MCGGNTVMCRCEYFVCVCLTIFTSEKRLVELVCAVMRQVHD